MADKDKADTKGLSDALRYLKKEIAGAFEVDEKLTGISTGSLAVDIITGIGGFPRGRLSEVFGWESCLAGSTRVHYTTFKPGAGDRPKGKGRRAQNCKGGTIERLYRRFHNLPYDGRGRPANDEALEFYVPSVNEEGRIFLNRVIDVVETGVKPCFCVTTETGRTITATADHKFYAEDRYLPLEGLVPGMSVSVHGNVPYRTVESMRVQSRQYLYVKAHGVAGVKVVGKQYRYHRLLRSRAVIEARLNGLNLEAYVDRLNAGDLKGLTFLAREDHVHHLDENFLNDDPMNLVVMPGGEHSRLHALDRHNTLRFAVVPDRISRIEVVGRCQTYDLRVASPFNNYVANDFVVHNSGKTTLCMMACAAAQAEGLYPVYIDTERGVDLTLARNIGWITDDETKGLYLTPDSFEETVRIVERLTETGNVDLVIVDSVPGMVPQSVFDGRIDETGRIGEVARLLASVLPRLTKTAEKSNTAVIFINQMRQVVDMGGWKPAFQTKESKEKTFGGSALKFFSSLRIDLRIVQKGAQKTKRMDHFTAKEIDVPVANTHEAQAFKNKVAAPYRKATFTIRFDEARGLYGIDNRQTVIDLATSYGVIQHKGGGNYTYDGPGGNFTVRGSDQLYDFVASHPDIGAALFAAVTALPEIKASLQR